MERKIMEVLRRMQTVISEEQLGELKNVLNMVFAGCELQENTDLRVVDGSWRDDMEDFLMSKALGGLAVDTVDRYRYELTRMLSYVNKAVKEITEGDVSGYLRAYKRLRKVCNQTLKNVRSVFSTFFSWLRDRGRIIKNPMALVENIKVEKKIRKPLLSRGNGRGVSVLFVFFPRGRAAAQMPLGLVAGQHRPHLRVQAGADRPQPEGDVLVYRRLAAPEGGGRRADGRAVLNDVLPQQDGPPDRIAFHHTTPPRSLSKRYAGRGRGMRAERIR